ncbi:MAG: PLD nuclease N-terminal domain-containing protein [Dehalococcoidia bacterium]
MSEFWWGLLWLTLFIPLMFLWGFALWDIFSRHDLRGWAKALWAIAIVFFPIIGLLVYFIARPQVDAYGSYATLDPYPSRYTGMYPYPQPSYRPEQERASGPSPAVNDMATLTRLHDSGTISDAEFADLQGRMTKQDAA